MGADEKITLTQAELDAKIADAIKEQGVPQAELDKIIGFRLDRLKKEYADYDELKKFREDHQKAADEKDKKALEEQGKYEEAKAGYEKKIAELQGIITDKDGKIRMVTISNALTNELVKQGAFIEEANALLQTQTIIGDDGAVRIKAKDANGQDTLLSVEEGVKKFLEGRPHLVKAKGAGGGGTGAGGAGAGAGAGSDDLNALNAELIQALQANEHKRAEEIRAKIRANLNTRQVNRIV